MRTSTDLKEDQIDLPKEGDIFFYNDKEFKVLEVIHYFNDYLQKNIAEIVITTKNLGIKIIINSSSPFITEE